MRKGSKWVLIILSIAAMIGIGYSIKEITSGNTSNSLAVFLFVSLLIINLDLGLLNELYFKKEALKDEEKIKNLENKFWRNMVEKHSYTTTDFILSLYMVLINLIFVFGLIMTVVGIGLLLTIVLTSSPLIVELYFLAIVIVFFLFFRYTIILKKYDYVYNKDIIKYFFEFKEASYRDKYCLFLSENIIPLLSDIHDIELEDKEEKVTLKYIIFYLKNIVLRLNIGQNELKRLLKPFQKKIYQYDYKLRNYLDDLNKKIRNNHNKAYKSQICLLKSIYKKIDDSNVFILSKSLSYETKLNIKKIFSIIPLIFDFILKYKWIIIVLLIIISSIINNIWGVDILGYIIEKLRELLSIIPSSASNPKSL